MIQLSKKAKTMKYDTIKTLHVSILKEFAKNSIRILMKVNHNSHNSLNMRIHIKLNRILHNLINTTMVKPRTTPSSAKKKTPVHTTSPMEKKGFVATTSSLPQLNQRYQRRNLLATSSNKKTSNVHFQQLPHIPSEHASVSFILVYAWYTPTNYPHDQGQPPAFGVICTNLKENICFDSSDDKPNQIFSTTQQNNIFHIFDQIDPEGHFMPTNPHPLNMTIVPGSFKISLSTDPIHVSL